jgi:TPR repeat protein
MQSFLNADKLGHACATYTIGCFYEFGLGVECNKDRAYELYEEAFKNKFRDPRASYKLTVLKLIKNTIKK